MFMLIREALDIHLVELEARMPRLTEDMDMLFRAFEDEGDRLMGEAAPHDPACLGQVLLRLCQRHGVTPQDLAP